MLELWFFLIFAFNGEVFKNGTMRKIFLVTITAWFLFMRTGQSILDEAVLISTHAFPTEQKCVETAKLLQAGRLLPFYYCVGSPDVSELPGIAPRQGIINYDNVKPSR